VPEASTGCVDLLAIVSAHPPGGPTTACLTGQAPSRLHPARMWHAGVDAGDTGQSGPLFRQASLWRFVMKLVTTAGLVLAILLAGCTMTPGGSSSASGQKSSMRSDPANYHADNFGEPDNTPFQGVYPGR